MDWRKNLPQTKQAFSRQLSLQSKIGSNAFLQLPEIPLPFYRSILRDTEIARNIFENFLRNRRRI